MIVGLKSSYTTIFFEIFFLNRNKILVRCVQMEWRYFSASDNGSKAKINCKRQLVAIAKEKTRKTFYSRICSSVKNFKLNPTPAKA